MKNVAEKKHLLFDPEHKVLPVDNGLESGVLIVKPENECQKQKIDLPKMGTIHALRLFQDHIVLFHAADDEFKISYLYLLGIRFFFVNSLFLKKEKILCYATLPQHNITGE